MSNQFKAAPPRGGYVYQKLEYDPIQACTYIQNQNYFGSPDGLVRHVLHRIAPLGDGARRLKELREFIDTTLDGLAKQAVKDLTR